MDQSRSHNLANEIGRIDQGQGQAAWIDPQHDDAGNMTRAPSPLAPDEAQFYVYDAWNRLVAVDHDDQQQGTQPVAEYQYDGRNYRVVKHVFDGGELDVARHFYYNDRWQCLEERLADTGVISSDAERQMVWGPRYIDDLVLRDRDTDANGSLDERLYALQDANWNVTAVIALVEVEPDVFEWQPVERYLYTPYGAMTVLGGSFVPRNPNQTQYAWDIGYAGYRLDLETLLHQVRNRYYHSELGRFIARDYLGYDTGLMSLYAYCATAPLTNTDPTGLWEELEHAFGGSTSYWGNFGLENLLPPCTGRRKQVDGAFYHRTTTANATTPSSNGCGPQGGIDVPDGFRFGGVYISFLRACNAHDICYATCGSSKAKCDMDFYWDIRKACDTAGLSWYNQLHCWMYAMAYHRSVELGGRNAYEAAQDDVCAWECCKKE